MDSNGDRVKKYAFLLLGLVSAAYYSVLSAKQFTWVFGSGDSGDFLAAAKSWLPPQPFGNPFYVLLGHLLDALPGDLVVKMTVVGSCLASAVTVAVTFAIVERMTKSTKIGLLAGVTLMASPVFLSQSTVLSQYSLAVLAVVLAFWFRLNEKHKLTALCLGAGTAMHAVVAVIALLWFVIEWRQGRLKEWVRLIPMFIAIGGLPYCLTLWELWRLHGTLSLGILLDYTSNTSGAGMLAASVFYRRFFWFAGLMLTGLGVAIIPAYYGFKDKSIPHYGLLLTPVVFVSWYYLTAADPTTWHYLPWVMPFLVIFAGVGMQKLVAVWRPIIPAVAVSVAALLIVNTIFLNANVEAERNPVAMDTYRQFAGLPQGATVDVPDMGWIGFAFRYVQVNERPDLIRREP